MARHLHIHFHDAEGPAHDPANGQFTSSGAAVAHHKKMEQGHLAKAGQHGRAMVTEIQNTGKSSKKHQEAKEAHQAAANLHRNSAKHWKLGSSEKVERSKSAHVGTENARYKSEQAFASSNGHTEIPKHKIGAKVHPIK